MARRCEIAPTFPDPDAAKPDAEPGILVLQLAIRRAMVVKMISVAEIVNWMARNDPEAL